VPAKVTMSEVEVEAVPFITSFPFSPDKMTGYWSSLSALNERDDETEEMKRVYKALTLTLTVTLTLTLTLNPNPNPNPNPCSKLHLSYLTGTPQVAEMLRMVRERMEVEEESVSVSAADETPAEAEFPLDVSEFPETGIMLLDGNEVDMETADDGEVASLSKSSSVASLSSLEDESDRDRDRDRNRAHTRERFPDPSRSRSRSSS
jgi:D-ribose pyranose/furanose isomerase RbsD